jgi:hypothetical protein
VIGMLVIQYKREHAPRQDSDPIPTGDAVRDLSRELFVVHEQEVDLLDIVHHELFEAVRQEMSRLPVPQPNPYQHVWREITAGGWMHERGCAPSCCYHSRSWAWEPVP